MERDVIDHKCEDMVKTCSEIFTYKGDNGWYMRFEFLGDINQIIYCPYCGTKLEVKE